MTPKKEQIIPEDALRRAHEKGLSLAEAGRVLGVSPQAVSYRWRQLGLKPHRKTRLPKTKRVHLTFSLHPSVSRLIVSLARRLGISKSEVVSEAVKSMVEKYKYTRQHKQEKENKS